MPSDLSQNTTSATQTAIMEATYCALCEHGYADLSMSKIADEFEKSKSLVYYHYEDKDELLVAFLDYVIEQFSQDIAVDAWTDPEAQLRSFFDLLLPETLDDDKRDFQVAMFELRAQAPHNKAYREQFTRTDQFVRETIAEYVEVGIEQGSFREVDPDETAQLFLTVLNGGMLERVTSDAPDTTETLRRAIDEYIRTHLTPQGRA